jgi:CRISPR-associated DxTHG motif protein
MQEPKMTKKRILISFLGLGHYDNVRYLHGDQTKETPWVAVALYEFLNIEKVLFLGTPTSIGKTWQKLEKDLLSEKINYEQPLIYPEPDPNNLKYNEQFELLLKLLKQESKHEIIIDITHSFRAFPVYAVVTAFHAYLQGYAPNLSLVYGALDYKTKSASIWDLSKLVDLMKITDGLDLFRRTGDAGRLVAPIRELGGRLCAEWFRNGKVGERPAIDKLSKLIERFSQNLMALRTEKLFLPEDNQHESLAQQLLKKLSDSKEAMAKSFPALQDELERLARRLEGLSITGENVNLADSTAQESLANLAEWYLEMGRYSESLATLREAMVSRFSPKDALPGTIHVESSRYKIESRLNRLTEQSASPQKKAQLSNEERKIVSLWSGIRNHRNDLLHAGYRENPIEARKFPLKIGSLIKNFRETINFTLGEEPLVSSPLGPVFLNLSNHPSAGWTDKQKEAARELAPEVVDLDFPWIEPDKDLEDVQQRAQKIVEHELPQGISHAMIQGEFTMTMLLVKALQAKGIRCYAATTQRVTDEIGPGVQRSAFHFIQFRPYPEIK